MDGLWTIEFGSNAGLFGSGVAVLRDGKVQGGDQAYYYEGEYESAAVNTYPAILKAKITITPYLPNHESIFKTFDKSLTLLLEGTFKDENSAVAIGTPEGMPDMNIGMRLTRKAA
jgi:hypothetical protein